MVLFIICTLPQNLEPFKSLIKRSAWMLYFTWNMFRQEDFGEGGIIHVHYFKTIYLKLYHRNRFEICKRNADLSWM